MSRFLTLLFLTMFIFSSAVYGQSKKKIKQYNIKTVSATKVEGDKSNVESVSTFDKQGNEIETIEYSKEGKVKLHLKMKYNNDGDEIEREEYDASNKLVEKIISSYNSLGEKKQEIIFDTNGVETKRHLFEYDSRGLKSERKTIDKSGNVVGVKKYSYTK